jgi:phosphoglucomutase
MYTKDILTISTQKANEWLSGNYDSETKRQISYLIENDEKELVESFYQNLEFGTGGLRGIMGVGTNRMNIYTVGMATQGLTNYLKFNFSNLKQIKVAIAYDSRNNSKFFAETCAGIFSANDFKVYLFESLRPTPELSFAVRHFGCQSGVVITASHNPKEYNGYKAYWDDGGQLIEPHDKNVIDQVLKITNINDVKISKKAENIQIIGNEIDKIYLDNILKLSLSPDIIKKFHDLKIVYTPLHGSGTVLVPKALTKFGFTNISVVEEQRNPDGNFPTVKSPNPEEPSALNLAIEKAKAIDAKLVLATDPDADRVGIAVRNHNNDFILLNGNQTGVILIYYLLNRWHENKKIKGNEFIVKTIVTSELIVEIANKFKVECYDVLTGFKYIADIIKKLEGKKQFICGGEESYGYLAGDFVRDKDAVISCSLIAETLAFTMNSGKSLFDFLLDIYIEFGYYKESLVSITKKGISGLEEISAMMKNYRTNPPSSINNSNVIFIKDYLLKKETDCINGKIKNILLPESDVLQFLTEDGSKISIRPSGTEPKIKFYFSVKEKLNNKMEFESVSQRSDNKIELIKNAILGE